MSPDKSGITLPQPNPIARVCEVEFGGLIRYLCVMSCLKVHAIEAAHPANNKPRFQHCLQKFPVFLCNRLVVLKPKLQGSFLVSHATHTPPISLCFAYQLKEAHTAVCVTTCRGTCYSHLPNCSRLWLLLRLSLQRRD